MRHCQARQGSRGSIVLGVWLPAGRALGWDLQDEKELVRERKEKGKGGQSSFRGPEVDRKRLCQQREELHWCPIKQKSSDIGKLHEIGSKFKERIPPECWIVCWAELRWPLVQSWCEWAWEGTSSMTSAIGKILESSAVHREGSTQKRKELILDSRDRNLCPSPSSSHTHILLSAK